MPGKWDWLMESLKDKGLRTKYSLIFKFIGKKISGADDITKCALCPNMCRHACPVSIVDGKETTSPAGKARIALFINKKVIDLNLDNIYPLYMCLSCDACTQWCPFEFSVADLIRPLKEEAVRKGIIPNEIRDVFDKLESSGNIYGRRIKEPSENKRGNVLFLRGCEIIENFPELADKSIALLKKLGYEPFTLENEKCCGMPAYNLGNIDLFKKLAKENTKIINSLNVSLIITSCPSCAYAYRVLYKKFGINLKPKVLHITEALRENLKEKLIAHESLEVTYHDPCKLAISLNEPDLLRNILEKIEGVSVKAPRRHGKNTFCCGYGGSAISRLNPKLANEIAKERISELKEEANVIITACPTCKKALSKVNSDITVLDIIEFLNQFI